MIEPTFFITALLLLINLLLSPLLFARLFALADWRPPGALLILATILSIGIGLYASWEINCGFGLALYLMLAPYLGGPLTLLLGYLGWKQRASLHEKKSKALYWAGITWLGWLQFAPWIGAQWGMRGCPPWE